MFQFSLRHLLIAVAAVALGAAALINANDWWASGLWAVTYLVLAYSALASIFRRETKRAFWMGYLVAGSVYVILLTFLDGGQQPELITTKILDFAYSAL